MKNLKKILQNTKKAAKESKDKSLKEKYFKLLIIKQGKLDLKKLKAWADVNNQINFYESMKNTAQNLTEYMEFDIANNTFIFKSNKQKEQLFQDITITERVVEKNGSVSEELKDAFYKFDKLLSGNQTQEINKFIENSKNIIDKVSFNNIVYLHVQADGKNLNIEHIRSFKEWKNTSLPNGEDLYVNKGEKAFRYITPKDFAVYEKDEDGNFLIDDNDKKIPKLDDNNEPVTARKFLFTNAFDVKQTNAIENGFTYNDYNLDFELFYKELEYSINSNLNEIKLNIEGDIHYQDKIIEIYHSIADYYFGNNLQSKKIFTYLIARNSNIEYNLIDNISYDSNEDAIDQLRTIVNVYKNVSKKLLLKNIIENSETSIFYEQGLIDSSLQGQRKVDNVVAHENAEQLSIKFGDYLAEDYIQGYQKTKEETTNEQKSITTRDRQSQSRKFNDNNEGLPRREQERDVPGSNTKETTTELPERELNISTNSDQSINGKRINGERSLRDSEQGDDLYLENIDPKFKYEIDQEKRKISFLNLKEYFNTREIEQNFIHKGVTWIIVADKYIFDLDNQEHTQAIKDVLSLDFNNNRIERFGAGFKGGVDTIIWDRETQEKGDYKTVARIDKGIADIIEGYQDNQELIEFIKTMGATSFKHENIQELTAQLTPENGLTKRREVYEKIEGTDELRVSKSKLLNMVTGMFIDGDIDASQLQDKSFLELVDLNKSSFDIEVDDGLDVGSIEIKWSNSGTSDEIEIYESVPSEFYQAIKNKDLIPEDLFNHLQKQSNKQELAAQPVPLSKIEEIPGFKDLGKFNTKPFEDRKKDLSNLWDNSNQNIRKKILRDYFSDSQQINEVIQSKSEDIDTIIHTLTNWYKNFEINENNNEQLEIDKITQAFNDEFFAWTKTDILEALKDQELNEDVANALIEKYDDLNRAYAKEQEERINKELEDTPYKVSIFQTSENYDEELKRGESDEYWNLSMFEAYVEYKESEEEVEDTTTGRYVEAESVVSEIKDQISELLNQSKNEDDLDQYLKNKLMDNRQENFTIKTEIAEGGAKTKFKNNIAAIEVIRKLEANEDIIKEDKIILSKYVGWGGISQAFYKPDGSVAKGWENEAEELKITMTKDEYEQARRSTLDSYYTSELLCSAMWKAVDKFGFSGGTVADFAVGTGNFFGYMPKHLKPNSQLIGVELDSTTSKIAQTLYPKAKIYNTGFQNFKLIDGQEASLVIGNPPYGSHKITDKENKTLNKMSIHNYFMCKSIDSLEIGGVMAMVVSNSFMDSNDLNAKAYIGAKANLVSAIRLPNNAFSKNANTEVTTDILFFQRVHESEETNLQDWLSIGELNDTPINKYFENNQKNLLGKWGKYGTMYRGDSPALIPIPGQNTKELLDKAIEELPVYRSWDFDKQKYNYNNHNGYHDNGELLMKGVGQFNQLAQSLQAQNGDTMTSDARVNAFFVNDETIYKRLPDINGEVQIEEITTKTNSKGDEVELKDKEIERIKGMIEVAEAANKLKVAQLTEDLSDEYIDTFRDNLNRVYDKFTKKYGYLNNATNKRLFEEDVNSSFLLALEKKHDKGISKAIANRTGETPRKESVQKADIFTKRTQRPYNAPTTAESYEDALLISLGEKTYVDLNYMSELLGKDIDEIQNYLSSNNLIYDDPNYGWVTAEEYLSGNVKEKLAQTTSPKNIAALEKVIPKDIEAIDIAVQPGASWIPRTDMEDFIFHISGDQDTNAVYTHVNAQWNISTIGTTVAQEQWGTSRKKVKDIIDAALNNKQITVYDQVDDGNGGKRAVVNQEDTLAANDKLDAIKSEWDNWIWKTDDRRDRLAKIYNDKFNIYAKREYNGSSLQFPGKSNTVDLRPHQENGAWRVLQGGTTLFDHTVGTGKTFTAITSAMELKRTGKAKKPMVVVPNHLVQQWGKEWLELYPNANILLPTKKDFESKRRKILMSRIATGEYDAIIIAHSQLAKIENDVDFEKKFLEKQIEDIQDGIDAVRELDDMDGRSVKQWENTQERLVAKIEELTNLKVDDNITFLELGIDAMIIDEAHEFKNLQFHTSMQRVAGLGNPTGSKKAFDLYIKTQSLLDRTNGNNLVFLTGTPISNTIAEMYTMQRYLQGETLKNDGLTHFDAWVKQYADVVTDWELSPSGKYKLNTRLSKFKNMPELIGGYNQFADVVTREDINKMLAKDGKKLPIPKIKGGKPNNIIVDRSEDQADFIGVKDENGIYSSHSLVYRSENLPSGKPAKGDDNMLVIMSDARKASLDMRLIDSGFEDFEGSKVNQTVRDALDIYHKWEKQKGTQLIFCDLSTPKGAIAGEKAKILELVKLADAGDEKATMELDKISPDEIDALSNNFSVYDDLKAKFIKAGISESEVAFIHDAKTDIQKAELFGKVNSGRIRILLGSTSKMGAGMNVQKKLVALHHLDAPWRPSDLEQREGRIIRQGNELYGFSELLNEYNFNFDELLNDSRFLLFLSEFNIDVNEFEKDIDIYINNLKEFEIEINRYATKNTLDSRMWQTIESKAKFIEQIKLGNIDSREVEDISSEAANAAEMKAASSGNPLILEEMTLKQDMKKLEAIEKEFNRGLYQREDKIRHYEKEIKYSSDFGDQYLSDMKLYNEYLQDIENQKEEYKKLERENKASGNKEKLKPVSNFQIQLGKVKYDKREDAGAYIIKAARELKLLGRQGTLSTAKRDTELGSFGGFKISLYNSQFFEDDYMDLVISGQRDYVIQFHIKQQSTDGLTLKLTNRLKEIEDLYTLHKLKIDKYKKELPELQAQVKEFPRADELALLKQRHKTVITELQEKDKENNNQKANSTMQDSNKYQITNHWIDYNKDLSAIDILKGKRAELSIIESISCRVIGKCIVIDEQLERDKYKEFEKIFKTFGGEWKQKLQAISFSDDGIQRMIELKPELEITQETTSMDKIKQAYQNKEIELPVVEKKEVNEKNIEIKHENKSFKRKNRA